MHTCIYATGRSVFFLNLFFMIIFFLWCFMGSNTRGLDVRVVLMSRSVFFFSPLPLIVLILKHLVSNIREQCCTTMSAPRS